VCEIELDSPSHNCILNFHDLSTALNKGRDLPTGLFLPFILKMVRECNFSLFPHFKAPLSLPLSLSLSLSKVSSSSPEVDSETNTLYTGFRASFTLVFHVRTRGEKPFSASSNSLSPSRLHLALLCRRLLWSSLDI
jgi:hypothetical protein